MSDYDEPAADYRDCPEAAVIADLADTAAARERIELVDGRLAGFVLAVGQSLETVDLDEYGDRPARQTGTVRVADAVSLAEYVNRYKLPEDTTLWADVDRGTVTAVINDHPFDSRTAGWGDHRAVLQLVESPDWKHWASGDGKLMAQAAFAEHIEDGAHCIRSPEPAAMLEIAQTFHARTGVEFKSSSRLQSGEVQLQYEETTTAHAGKRGALEIPDHITLALDPFDGSPRYELIARFRYRITNGSLSLGYRLLRPHEARSSAFADVLTQIATGTELTVLAGSPR